MCLRAVVAWVLGVCAVAVLNGCGPESQTDAVKGSPTPPGPNPAQALARPTNVVWVLLDACRPDHLSCYGYGRPTSPNIDRIAARGTQFERNFAQGPNTLLSVESYMTGRYYPAPVQDARHLGLWFLRTPQPDEKLLPAIFGENGYTTAMFSASPWYTESSRLGKSFGNFRWLTYGPFAPEGRFEEVNPWVFDWIRSHKDEPFFLYLHLMDTHQPRYFHNTVRTWLDPSFPEQRDLKLREWLGAPYSEADQRHIVNLYDGGIAYADDAIGSLIKTLEAADLMDKTLIVIGADHGELLGEDGKTLGHPDDGSADDQLLVPLVLAGPGVPQGLVVRSLTQNMDIAPTLVSLLGLNSNARFEGESLQATMTGARDSEIHEYAFSRSNAFFFTSEPNRVLVFPEYKFEFAPGTGHRTGVWAVPDRVRDRTSTEPPAQLGARAQELIATVFDPAWHSHEAQPRETPPYFELTNDHVLNHEAVTTTDDASDNLWTRLQSAYLFKFREQTLLISRAYLEDSPGLVLSQQVADGIYTVSIYCRTVDSPDGEQRGSSFTFLRDPDEKVYRVFGVGPAAPGETSGAWLEVGTYEVTGGKFVYWMDEGHWNDNTVIGAIRFVSVGHEAVVPREERTAEEEAKLEALGYAGAN